MLVADALLRAVLTLLLAVTPLAASRSLQQNTNASPAFASILDATEKIPDLSMLNGLIKEAGMEDTFGPDAKEAVTLCAPNNEAIQNLGDAELQRVAGDAASLC